MFATCLFCNKSLGGNEALEAFPVGRRLAFDPARGRLWVVCPHCERWNLSPLEERWEAIEQSEKLYRDTRRRVATDNIGLARLRDGTTLVRIGEPLRPEFAAWRYGDQFGRRRRRQLLIAGGGVAAIGALVTAGAAAGVGIASFGGLLHQMTRFIVSGSPETVVARIRGENGAIMPVRRRHLGETTISRDGDGLALDLRFKNGRAHLTGREAERVAAIIVPKVNRFGGDQAAVARAVKEIEDSGGSDGFLERISLLGSGRTTFGNSPTKRGRRSWKNNPGYEYTGLFALPKPHRLALEMALHEEAERRALQGELEALENAWREAEEIAAIADSLVVPREVAVSMERLRGTAADES